MNKNLFKVKKEKKYSPFNHATLTLEKDRGPKTTKRFFLDHNAIEALDATGGANLGFILDDHGAILIANISNLDKEALGMASEDINTVAKTKVKRGNFYYASFANRVLYDRLVEEFELDPVFSTNFTLTVVNPDGPFTPLTDYLAELGVTKYLLLDLNIIEDPHPFRNKYSAEDLEEAMMRFKERETFGTPASIPTWGKGSSGLIEAMPEEEPQAPGTSSGSYTVVSNAGF